MVVVCGIGAAIARRNIVDEAQNMGSFTFDKTSSYDGKYYAVSDKTEGKGSIVILMDGDVLIF